jgi:Leucine-rich repeat (LRR) protein
VVNLKGNRITDLGSGIFGGLQNLQSVDLRNNLLTSLPRNSLKVAVFEGKWNNLLTSLPRNSLKVAVFEGKWRTFLACFLRNSQ